MFCSTNHTTIQHDVDLPIGCVFVPVILGDGMEQHNNITKLWAWDFCRRRNTNHTAIQQGVDLQICCDSVPVFLGGGMQRHNNITNYELLAVEVYLTQQYNTIAMGTYSGKGDPVGDPVGDPPWFRSSASRILESVWNNTTNITKLWAFFPQSKYKSHSNTTQWTSFTYQREAVKSSVKTNNNHVIPSWRRQPKDLQSGLHRFLCCVLRVKTKKNGNLYGVASCVVCVLPGDSISWFSLVESWGRGAEGHSDAQNPPKIPHWKYLQENSPVRLNFFWSSKFVGNYCIKCTLAIGILHAMHRVNPKFNGFWSSRIYRTSLLQPTAI